MPAPKSLPTLQDQLSALGGELVLSAVKPNLLRYHPHEKQELFHRDQHLHRLLIAGNRFGKTVAGTCEGLYHARGSHPFREVNPNPTVGRVIGTDFPSGVEKVLLPLYAQWTPPSLLKNGSWEDSYSQASRKLTLSNRSVIEFMSYDQDVSKFAGASRDWIHFDEEPPQLVYDENRARLIDTHGPWWMTLTPVLGLDYIYDTVYLPGKQVGGHPLFGVIEGEMSDNTHLDAQSIEEYLGSLGAEMREVRSQGRFVQVSGTVFSAFDKDVHVIARDQFRLTPRHRVYVSIDHGWRDDTAVLWHAVDEDENVVTFDELYVNHTLTRDIATQIKDRNAAHGISRPFVYVGDPAMKQTNATTGTNTVMEFARNGIPIAVEGISRDVAHGIERMMQYLTPDPDTGRPKWRIVGQDAPNLVRQLATNRFQRRAGREAELTLNKLMKVQDKDNHATDSARFFFVMMPDLAPRRAKSKQEVAFGGFSDTLGAKGFASRRDPGPKPKWNYESIDEFDLGDD